MSEVAYLDQNTLLGRCYQTKSYAFLREKILGERDVYTKVLHADGEVYGYTITLNEPLTELYDFSCYVVKFVFSKVDTLHSSNQEKIMLELCVSLKNDMEAVKGYYTMRVPAHIVDLIRAINQTFTNLIFCGGTVDVVFSGPLSMQKWDKDIEVFIADQSFMNRSNAIRDNTIFLPLQMIEQVGFIASGSKETWREMTKTLYWLRSITAKLRVI